RDLLAHRIGSRLGDGGVAALQLGGERGVQLAVLAAQRDPTGAALAAELQADDDDEQQREDEREEDVGAVTDEAPQLGAGDRQGCPHAAAPRSGTSRETSAP